MRNILGIDIGTSGCKAILIDELGQILAQASAEYPVSMPNPTWSEQNPEDWWRGVQTCVDAIGESWRLSDDSWVAGVKTDSDFVARMRGLGMLPESDSDLIAETRNSKRRRDDYVRTMTGLSPGFHSAAAI